jgi:predicted permease
MTGLLQDLRHAVRDLFKNPGFALLAILTLAIGIGASTAMFSVVRGVLLAPLPYTESDRLYRVFYTNAHFPRFAMNPTDFMDFRERNRVFESLAVYTQDDLELSGLDRPERLTALRISSDYFRVLGAHPILGRDFQASDELPGNDQSIMISHNLWVRRFSSDPNIVGRKVSFNRLPMTVIGVMAPGFEHPGGDYRSPGQGATVDAWRPFSFQRAGRGSHFLNGIARLKPGTTAKIASDDINRIAADLDKETYPSEWRLFLVPLREEIVGKSERMLLVLLGSVIFVLLIACVNVASLLLVRATARSRDMAVRAALGASRSRLIRQNFTESMLLALLGALGGQLLATVGVGVLAKMLAATLPRAHMIRIDPTLFAFTLALSIATALLFGVVPAIAGSRGDLNRTLHEAGRGATSGGRMAGLRNALVVGEIALAFALLVGAGLFLRSFVNLLHTDAGFQAENVLTARIVLPRVRYGTQETKNPFFHELIDRISNLPGVRAVGASSDVPWTSYDENSGFTVEGRLSVPNDEPHARYHSATPDYFRAMGIPLIKGRFLTDADDPKAPIVVVINSSMARKYWPGQDAVGKRITFSDKPAEKDWTRVVGVVGDVKDTASAAAAEPAFWWSQQQQGFGDMLIAVRAAGDPTLLVGTVRNQLAQMDAELPLTDVRTMEQVASASMGGPRLLLVLTGVFSALALGLAAIGTYGVIAYSVAQRTHEFGLRIALGARGWDIVKLVGGQGLRLALSGIVIGFMISLALGRLLDKLLYGVKGYDPLTSLAAFAGALMVAMLAGYIPARRATQVDPMISLRSE